MFSDVDQNATENRIQAGVAEGGGVSVLRVRVEGNHLPLDGIEHQLMKKGVVCPDEALDVLFRHH